MANQPIFQSVEIRDFRGFSEPQRLDLDGSAVLIVGSNGTGKTSFFDAIQWLLTGDVPRLRERSGQSKAEWIVNQWSEMGTAEVNANIVFENQAIEVRRVGSTSGSSLMIRDQQGAISGEQAEHRLASLFVRGGTSLREALPISGLLQQDVLRSVIEGEPTERYERLARLLGLEGMPVLEKQTRTIADALRREATDLRIVLDRRESELQEAELRLGQLSKQLENTPRIQDYVFQARAVLQVTASGFELIREFPADLDELSAFGHEARRIRDESSELLGLRRRLDSEQPNIHEIRSRLDAAIGVVGHLASELAIAADALNLATANLDNAEKSANQMSALAAYAIPLLSARCPVCQQTIVTNEVNSRLRRLVEQGSSNFSGIVEAVDQAKAHHDSLGRKWHEACAIRDEITTHLASARQWEEESQRFLAACAGLAEGLRYVRLTDAKAVREGTESALALLWRSATEVERVTREAASVFSVQELSKRIGQARSQVQDFAAEAERVRRMVADANHRAAESRKVAHATTQAVSNVVKQRFNLLAPLLAEIYSRLDPHPAFTSIDYDLALYRKRAVANPVVIDEKLGNRVDPLLVFSSSQTNVVALSFFLAMNWTNGSYSLPFLLLDDPLQAMDDINALGFADLCRHIRAQRQLIVSTHDRRLGALLERKLAPRAADERTIVLRFLGWERGGPQIEGHIAEPQLEAAERRFLIAA